VYKWAPSLVAAVGLLAIWLGLCWTKVWPPYLFPSPADVIVAYALLARSGFLEQSLVATITRLGIGFGISMVGGGAIGLASGVSPRFRVGVQPFLLGVQSLPGVAWVPLAILWFGYSETALLFVTVAGSIFAIGLAFGDALNSVPPVLWRSARNLGATHFYFSTRVAALSAAPQLISGAKQGWAFAWRSLIGAEIVFAGVGLGFLLNQGRDLLDTAQVFAMMVLIIAIGVLFDRLVFTPAENWVRLRWGLERQS
jgi:NitT/TauT family transport system permease protein